MNRFTMAQIGAVYGAGIGQPWGGFEEVEIETYGLNVPSERILAALMLPSS